MEIVGGAEALQASQGAEDDMATVAYERDTGRGAAPGASSGSSVR